MDLTDAKPRTAQATLSPLSRLFTSIPQEEATQTPACAPASPTEIWPVIVQPFLWPAQLGCPVWCGAVGTMPPGASARVSKETALSMLPQTCNVPFFQGEYPRKGGWK